VKKWGTRIKQVRERRGWTQAELAKRAGISRGYVARVEINLQDPRLSMMVRIAKALHVSMAELFEGRRMS
jgi:transcriptional regulator with XRE-family HTH domain